MKRLALSAAALTLAGWTASVQAADFAYNSRAPLTVNQPLNGYSWAGPYLGGNLGYSWGSVDNNPTKPSGFVGGVQGGYSFQTGPWVYGLEGDIQATGADDTFAPWKFSNPWFGTLRGRVGYALNNILFYGTAGLAYGELSGELNSLDENKTLVGWAGGAGMEVGFNPRWSAKVEYLYMDLGDRAYTITGVNNALQSNLLRFGINYHF